MKKILYYIFSLGLTLFFTIAFKPGEPIELENFLKARSSALFTKETNNVVTILSKGTRGVVLETKKMPSGNFGIRIKVNTGTNKGKSYWLYYNPKFPSIKSLDEPPKAEVPKIKKAELVRDQNAYQDPAEKALEVAATVTVQAVADPKTIQITTVKRTPECTPVTNVEVTPDVPATPVAPVTPVTPVTPVAPVATADPIDQRMSSSNLVQTNNPEIKKMAEEITKNAKTPMEKSRAIHKWIAENISYDEATAKKRIANEPENSSQDALFVMKNKIAVCEGYANLAAAFHRAIGIPSKVTIGKFHYYSASAFDVLKKQNYPFIKPETATYFHAWNEILIDGKWVPMDTTSDSGYSGGSTWARSPKLNEEFFNPNLDHFNLTHQKTDYMPQ